MAEPNEAGGVVGESGRFLRALRLALMGVGALWAVQAARWLGLDLSGYGVLPGTLEGLLPGVLVAPALHGSGSHLLANSTPLVVLGTALRYVYPTVAWRVLGLSWVLPGLAVWAFGRGNAWHIGASGIVYSLAVFVFVSGLLRRDARSMALAMLAYFLYGGGLLWGVLPLQAGISWETHLAGGLTGLLLAVLWRDMDRLPPRRYEWESEPEAPETEDPQFRNTSL